MGFLGTWFESWIWCLCDLWLTLKNCSCFMISIPIKIHRIHWITIISKSVFPGCIVILQNAMLGLAGTRDHPQFNPFWDSEKLSSVFIVKHLVSYWKLQLLSFWKIILQVICLEVQFLSTMPIRSNVVTVNFSGKQIVCAAIGQWQLFGTFHCLSDWKFKYFPDNWANIHDIFSITSDQCPHPEDENFSSSNLRWLSRLLLQSPTSSVKKRRRQRRPAGNRGLASKLLSSEEGNLVNFINVGQIWDELKCFIPWAPLACRMPWLLYV